MSKKDSVTRLANSRIVPERYWWKQADFAALAKAALEAGEGAIVSAYPGLNVHGMPDLHFTVTRPGAKTLDGSEEEYNYSWLCPPVCPD